MDPTIPQHIFVVEHGRLFVKMLDYVFSKDLRYRFLDFRSGEDCLKNLHLSPALIVLDYALPGMNGFETLLEIREQLPQAEVMILLSPGDKRLPAEFLNAGASDFVLKDGTEEQKVIEKVEAFLSRGGVSRKTKKTRQHSSLTRKICYAILILVLVSLGVYYFQ